MEGFAHPERERDRQTESDIVEKKRDKLMVTETERDMLRKREIQTNYICVLKEKKKKETERENGSQTRTGKECCR